jgi:hypothetical protein
MRRLFAALIALAAADIVRLTLNVFGKYFDDGPRKARFFIKELGRSLFDRLPQSEKLGHADAIFEAMLDGSLRPEDVKARVQNYITAHNRMFPTKFAKFGDSPLLSLDATMFDDGTTTRGDTVSRGLWD